MLYNLILILKILPIFSRLNLFIKLLLFIKSIPSIFFNNTFIDPYSKKVLSILLLLNLNELFAIFIKWQDFWYF